MLIIACVLVVTGVAAVVTFRTTPLYESQAKLFVSTADGSTDAAYQGSLFSMQRVASYADLVDGRELSMRVIQDLGLQVDAEELSEQITATVVPETVNLEIAVQDENPALAREIAASTSQQLIALIDELETPPGRANAPIKASVIDSASLPDSPVSPQPLRNIGLGVVLGLLLGLGLAVMRELLDTSIKSAEDLAEITETPVLGGILFDPDAPKRPLLSDLDPHSPRVEAFRILRTNLQFIDIDEDKKVIVFSSSVPHEGKTTTSSNVALALHEAGQRTLLIDGDMRRPQLAQLFDLERAVGLTTVLLGRMELKDAIQTDRGTGLHVLTSGNLPPNPAELLQSQAMAQLLTDARDEFDIVVIDAPPLLPVTDAALIAAQVDGAVLVVRQGATTKDQVAGSLQRLTAVGARPLGFAINMIPARKRAGGGYGYGYGYGYGSGYAPEKGRRAKD